jgi:hypothetical protein
METVSRSVKFLQPATASSPARRRTVSLQREDNIQRVLFAHLNRRAARGVVYWHTPNGGKRQISEAAKFKRLGVRPGMPDVMLLRGGELFALELKTDTGRLSDDQRATLQSLTAAGATVATAYGLDHALKLLEQWGIFEKSAK